MTSRSRCSYRFTKYVEYNAAEQIAAPGSLGTVITESPPFEEISISRTLGVDPSELMAGSRITGGYLTVQLMDYAVALYDSTDLVPGLVTTPRIPLFLRLGPFTRSWWLKGQGDIGIAGLMDNYIMRIPLSDVGFGRLSNDSISFALDTVQMGRDEMKFVQFGSDPARFPKLFTRPLRLSMLIGIYVGDPADDVLGTE